MAKVSAIVKNEKKAKLAKKYAAKRAELKKTIIDENATEEQRDEAFKKLNKMPRNTSQVRVRNRCSITGRPRGYYRTFKLSRITFRELALKGMIPGVTKASW